MVTSKMLAERNDYLSAGVHIGMNSCTTQMKRFVYKVRDDGLAVFNLRLTDERIKTAADFVSRFKSPIVVSRKANALKAVKLFGELTGFHHVVGRFCPGTLTNPSYEGFMEPDVLIVVDPLVDKQAMLEARKKRIPIVALCDTFNGVANVDFIIPTNNNGKKALAMIFMLLTKEIMRQQGKLKKDGDFKQTLKDFGGE